MPANMWADSGTWIALGVSALFVVVAWVMHRVIRKVLQAPPPDASDSPVASGPSSSPVADPAADFRPDSQENRTP